MNNKREVVLFLFILFVLIVFSIEADNTVFTCFGSVITGMYFAEPIYEFILERM